MTTRTVFLASLPAPEEMKRQLRMFAMHDAIVAPESRSFEFHPKWGPGNAQMGAFKDGSGNFFFAWFSPKGAVVRGFDHESAMSPFRREPPAAWPGIFDGLPRELRYVLAEPAFAQDEVTFALWRTGDDAAWRAGPVKLPKGKDPDGAAGLLGFFGKKFERWRQDYYEVERTKAIDVLWKEEPITREVVIALNPEADLKAVRAEAKLLGWNIDGLDGRLSKVQAVAPRKQPAWDGVRSFGTGEFLVRLEPKRVQMLIAGGTKVVAETNRNVYLEIFDLVKARLLAANATPSK